VVGDCYAYAALQGAVAQLVARLVRIEKVRGSIPLSSTAGQRPGPIDGYRAVFVCAAAKYSSEWASEAVAELTQRGLGRR
jgi:hypothetical protein